MPREFPVVGYGLTNAFGELTFDQPVSIANIPGETSRIFIVEKTGHIMVITNLAAPTKTEFLDATEELMANAEGGLLGLAFHPGYATNGFFYIYRTVRTSLDGAYNGYYDEVARYRVDPTNPDRALAGSQHRVLLQYDVDPGQHNAGDIRFGPDGYLYVTMGVDGPAPSETPRPPQAIDQHFFGSILRLDVDGRPGNLTPNPYPSGVANYFIPADNPFIGRTSFNGRPVNPARLRTELYAVGLRNPWRITFDGDVLYCGDVGSGAIEEVNVIRPGRNYGWPFFEGGQSQGLPLPPDFNMTPPVYSFSRGSELTSGYCMVGGVVYRGHTLPGLYGQYVFGDFVGGTVWAMDLNDATVDRATSIAHVPSLTTFGTDPSNGDVLAASLDGKIFRLMYVAPELTAAPLTLAQTGAFADLQTLAPADGLIPYEVSVPFWSDGAIKKRWFALPGTEAQVGFAAQTNWSFPAGSVWVKHFELELTKGVPASRRRLETRLLVKTEQGVYGVTYRWGDSTTDALLVPEGGMEERLTVRESGKSRIQTWIYPSRSACLKCHNAGAGYVLGFNTPQLNCEVIHEGVRTNQLKLLQAHGYIAGALPDPATLPALVDPQDRSAPLEHRVRSLLQANCSQCHYPGGPVRAAWDARITTPIANASILDANAVSFPWLKIIDPGNPKGSLMLKRLSQAFARMPPLATTELDRNAISLITEYAATAVTAPWVHQDVGRTGREGSASLYKGVYRLSGCGTNIAGTADAFHFLFQTLSGNGQVMARFVTTDSAQAPAGIMIRSSTERDASFVMLGPGAERIERRQRTSSGADVVITTSKGAPRWLRLVRDGARVESYSSTDGKNWRHEGSAAFPSGEKALAGLVVCATTNGRTATAQFDRVGVMGIQLAAPASGAVTVLPGTMELRAEVATNGTRVARVEFYANETLVGEVRRPPYAMTWRNGLAGEYVIRARAVDASGASVFSAGTVVRIDLQRARAGDAETDRRQQGDWRPKYGRRGFVLAGMTTNLPPGVQFHLRATEVRIWARRTNERRALLHPGTTQRSADAWVSDTNLTAELGFLDGGLRRVTLYFMDWESFNRSQLVEVFDAASGAILLSGVVSEFESGVSLSFVARGRIRIEVTHLTGPDAVLSGIFVDPVQSIAPTVEIIAPRPRQEFLVNSNVAVEVAAAAPNGIEGVELFVNGQLVGVVNEAPFRLNWVPSFVGKHVLKVRATDRLGQQEETDIEVAARLPLASAQLVRVDSTTQGRWIGVYGADGFAIPGYVTNYPAYARVAFEGATERIYLPENTARDLRRLDRDEGILSVWSVSAPVDFQFLDGSSHLLAVYFVDVERVRQQRVKLVSGDTGEPLSVVDLPTFGDGQYLMWNVRGHVRLELMNLHGYDTYISGLFFEAPAASLPAHVVGGWMRYNAEDGVTLEIRKRKGEAMPAIEVSTDLVSWHPATELEEVARRDDEANEIVTLRFPDATSTAQGFYRVIFR